MNLGRKQAYWAVCLVSVVAFVVLLSVSKSFCSVLEGVLASIVAAGIFTLILEILPYACREKERRRASAMVYRDLQLFLTRVDDFFLLPCWEATAKERPYDEWVANCGMGADEVFCRDFYGQWMKGFDVSRLSLYHDMSYWKYFQEEWNEAKTFYQQCMEHIAMAGEPDLDLVYAMQHIVYESKIGIAFRIVKENDTAGGRILGLFAFHGEDKMDRDIFQQMKELHRIADRMYESLKGKDGLAAEPHKPRLYQGSK